MTDRYPLDVEWEPLQVPTMDSIRALVAEPGSSPWPSSRDWGHGEVLMVVQKRWARAIRETCTHPSGFQASLATNVLAEHRLICPRCQLTEETAAGFQEPR